MAFSEYANWWDKQKRETEVILGEWVQDNPQWWAVTIATTVQTSMDLGAGFVDVLRFGEGMAEGGFNGVGKDALRLLAILGPLGRAGGMLSRLAHLRQIRLAVQVRGVTGPCTFQAVNNAMSITKGKSFFITLKDMADAVGKPIGSLTRNESGRHVISSGIAKALDFLVSQGVRIKRLANPNTVQEAIQLAQAESGVTIFAIRCTTTTGKIINHAVIAVRDIAGRLRFADYGGKYYGSLEELVAGLRYGPVDKAGISLMRNQALGTVDELRITGLLEGALGLFKGAVLVIEGMTAIETVDGLDLAAPVAVAATSTPTKRDPAPPEIVKGSFDAFRERKQGKTVIRMPEIVIKAGQKTAPRPDWLTGVQFRLNALGFGAGRVDGIKGPKTTRAVRAFQNSYPPLKVDGVPGQKTQEKLVEICGF